jgi:hypothetical protein
MAQWVPQIDFSSLGNLPETYRAGRIAGARSRIGDMGNAPPDAVSRFLFGAGDLEGGAMFSKLAQAQAARGQQAEQLAETIRHNKAVEGTAALTADKPVVLPWGSGLVKRTGEVIREPGGGETGMLDEPSIKFMAEQYRAGDTSVMTNLGRGAQGSANIVALRKEIARQNADAGLTGPDQAIRNAEFFGVKAGQRTRGVRETNIEIAATEFKQVLPIVQEASRAVSRSQYPDLNKVIQAFNERTGDPRIVAFGGGINTLVNLYARAISPSGVPTVSDKDHAREILQKAWSQGQFDAAVRMMTQEVDAALASPERVREEQRKRFLGGQGGATISSHPSAQAAPPVQGARQAGDGNWYLPDPNRPGKFLMVK